MLAIVLAAVLAQDGGVKFDAPIYATCPVAPPVVETDGGWFMPQARGERNACLMATCEADRQQKAKDLEAQPVPPQWLQVTQAVVITVAAAISAVSALGK